MWDQSPTALILNFSDIDLVPFVEELTKIFSGYGPLVAPGAEVFEKSVGAEVLKKSVGAGRDQTVNNVVIYSEVIYILDLL